VGVTDAVLTFLFNALWQVPLVAVSAGLISGLWRTASARDLRALYLAAAFTCAVLPAASVLLAAQEPVAAAVAPLSALDRPVVIATVTHVTAPLRPATADLLVLLFAAFVAGRLLVLARAWLHCRRIVREAGARPSDATLVLARECAAHFGVARVDVRLSDRVRSPLTLGLSVILLPPAIDSAAEDVRRAAIGHEMAHVRRHDFAWNVAVSIAGAAVSFHPAWSLLKRRLDAARESACDESVCAGWMPWRRYGRALVEVASSMMAPPQPVAAMGFWGASLEERIMRLGDCRRPVSWGFRAMAGAALLSSITAGTAFAVAVDGARVEAAVSQVESAVAAGERTVRDVLAPDDRPALYDPAGRRDPFQRFVVAPPPTTVEGPPRYRISEVGLRGIVQTPQGRIALIWTPSQKTHFVRIGQRFFDGQVTAIDADGVVLRQESMELATAGQTRRVRMELHEAEAPASDRGR